MKTALEISAPDPETVTEYYAVPHYDKQSRFQPHDETWPVLYRASGSILAYGPNYVEISIHIHPVVRYTPSGAWIATWSGEKFVNLRAGKQWASADEAEAIDQLWHRKRAQVRILSSRLAEAKQVKEAMAKTFDKKEPAPRTRYWSGYGEEY